MIENEDNKLLNWMLNNQELSSDVSLPVHEISVANCWEIVREWEECFDRGEPHIQAMCEDLKAGVVLPPILHDATGLPLDGRHRITAAVRLGWDSIDSIDLDELMLEMKKVRHRQTKEMSLASPEAGVEPG
jgi:hypothetical protein